MTATMLGLGQEIELWADTLFSLIFFIYVLFLIQIMKYNYKPDRKDPKKIKKKVFFYGARRETYNKIQVKIKNFC